ncbi:MAG: 2-amino-4-hydroxy-6-hydroxymethyldihydropteridine diphosphokinase [Candidatus Thermochlorobacter sp.]
MNSENADTIAYIGLGSNLGNRLAYLQAAICTLKALPHTTLLALSRVYETPPIGITEQPVFLNAVAQIHTALAPRVLLTRLKAIERALGRPEHYSRWSARIIDLDILLYGDLVICDAMLTIPHPELTHRKFAMLPLLDLADPIHPVFQQRISDLLAHTSDSSCVSVHPASLSL